MTSPTPVILLYGYGSNVGRAVLDKFRAQGWKTAAVVRTQKDEYARGADLVVQADFADGPRLQQIYADVASQLGTPSCVVYNAYSNESFALDAANLFAAAPAAWATDLAINASSFAAVAAAAAAGFARLPAGAPRACIFTGNGFPTRLCANVPGLGAGKAASAYLIEAAARTRVAGAGWYFADERLPDGWPIMTDLSGEEHAKEFWEMATREGQGPWNWTFAKGKGYVRFADVVDHEDASLQELLGRIGRSL